MITLERFKTVTLDFEEATVTLRICVLTPAEFARVQSEKMSNESIFEEFVDYAVSDDIEGWGEAVSAEDVLKMPGTASIIAQGALAVINNSLLTPSQKN